MFLVPSSLYSQYVSCVLQGMEGFMEQLMENANAEDEEEGEVNQ